MKKQLILAGLLVVGFASAQTEEDKKYQGNVGINTMKPQTTLDIAANTADGNKVEGLMVPRITYAKMQAMKANLTEYHDGLMVFVTDYVDMNTWQSKDGIYAPHYHSPYFVYNKHIQEFLPFSPSGLTEVMSKNGEPYNSFVLANKAMLFKMSQTPPQVGTGAIDLSTNMGIMPYATGDYSFSTQEGTASGNYSFATQGGNASGQYSFATQGGTASGQYATALGQRSQATGENSFATQGGTASGEYATAIGFGAQASDYAIALGAETKAIGYNSFATLGGTASGNYSFATLGGTASAYKSFAAQGGTAQGFFSTAFGQFARATGERSFAMHIGTAQGYYSTVIGGGIAEGDSSIAIGGIAKARHSVALKQGITTNVREFAFGPNFNTDTDVEVEKTRSGLSPTRQIFSVGRDAGSNIINQNALIILRNAHTGIGLPTDTTTPANSKPTEMLDVNGNIRVRGTAGITAGGACTNLGTITFSGDNFYGCKSTGWVRLNN